MIALIRIELDEEHLAKETNEIYDRLQGYNSVLMPLPCKEPMQQMPSSVLDMGKRKRGFIIHKVDVNNAYAMGWNDCIDEITGESDG